MFYAKEIGVRILLLAMYFTKIADYAFRLCEMLKNNFKSLQYCQNV